MLIQAFGTEPTIERFDESIVCLLARPGEIEHDAALVGPKVHVTRDELTALIHANGLGTVMQKSNWLSCGSARQRSPCRSAFCAARASSTTPQ